jgi:hypothetical protein
MAVGGLNPLDHQLVMLCLYIILQGRRNEILTLAHGCLSGQNKLSSFKLATTNDTSCEKEEDTRREKDLGRIVAPGGLHVT